MQRVELVRELAEQETLKSGLGLGLMSPDMSGHGTKLFSGSFLLYSQGFVMFL